MQDALIIDDNRNTADALKQMLDVLGVSARVSYGSSPAIALLQEYVNRDPRVSQTGTEAGSCTCDHDHL
jgi:hypothetical protein